jgi:hypothetical protein
MSDRSLLATALVAARLPETVPEACMLRGWLDSWSGVGHVVESMHGLSDDARLTQSPFEARGDVVDTRIIWATGAEGDDIDGTSGPSHETGPNVKPRRNRRSLRPYSAGYNGPRSWAGAASFRHGRRTGRVA